MFDRMPKILGSRPMARPFRENYLCTCTAVPRQNMKSIAQTVLKTC